MTHAQDRHREAFGLPELQQMILALHLADAVGGARIGVVGRMAAEMLAQRLDVAAAVDGL